MSQITVYVNCTECGRFMRTVRQDEDAPRVTDAHRACEIKKRKNWRHVRPGGSVHTMSGGLPTLGKRHR